MFSPRKTVLFVLLATISAQIGQCIRTKDKMYETIPTSKACFRRLNATHQIGCTSDRGGSTGAIHYCTTQSDLDFILKNGTAPPYVPILPTTLFTSANLARLKSSRKISGVLLYAAPTPPPFFTHEQQCPNSESSVPESCGASQPLWNPHGTGILHQDIPFPVFYVEDEGALASTRACFEKHNNFSYETQRDRSLCSLELNSFMYATTNTATCMRRSNAVTNLNPVKFCDPLGDRNVWASLYPIGGPQERYVVVAARLDATSLFEKTAGATAPITGLVALLTTAKLLKQMIEVAGAPGGGPNLLFVLFNGEAYDYIGSQRFVYDMLHGGLVENKSITIDRIDLFVELSQLNVKGAVVAHYVGDSRGFVDLLRDNKGAVAVEVSKGTLPPASLHSFLKNRTDLAGVVLADHKGAYTNQFYNSIYDNATSVGFDYDNPQGGLQLNIVGVAEMVAKSLYSEIKGVSFTGNVPREVDFVNELFHCYLEDANCKVHQAVQKVKLQNGPFSLYVGVEIIANFATSLVGLTLAWVTGDPVGPSIFNCTNQPPNPDFRFYNMSTEISDLNNTKCFRTTMNFSEAVSPAFIIADYDWSSGEYSTWAESTWGDIGLRLFLKPSAAHENMTIAVGSIVMILSFVCVYFVKSRSEVLFAGQLPSVAPTDC